MADLTPAGASSSPAADTLASLSSEQRAAWRLTGDLPAPSVSASDPDASSSPADSTPADPAAPDVTTVTSDPAASEPATPKKHANAETRIKELLAAEKRERDRANALEAQLRAAKTSTVETPPAASSPAPSGPRPLAEVIASPDLSQPPLDDGDFFSQYPTATIAQFSRYQANYVWQEKQAEQQRSQSRQTKFDAFRARLDADVKDEPDFVKSLPADLLNLPSLDQAQPGEAITPYHLIGQEIIESEHPKALLAHFAAHLDDLHALGRESAAVITRTIGRLDATLAASSSASPSPTTARRSVSSAPDATTSLGRRPAAPADKSLAAVADGDVRRYIAEENAKALARRRAG